MRIGALYDIHGNLPALDAGLAAVTRAAAADVRRTSFPKAEEFASVYIQKPPDMLDTFTRYGLQMLQAATDGA